MKTTKRYKVKPAGKVLPDGFYVVDAARKRRVARTWTEYQARKICKLLNRDTVASATKIFWNRMKEKP